ncbi:hypothetical protein AJ88_08615 [Mesorhizobium amorphae CCBAU 01583]|nr:hypothetical protein AJ88_08615 [Mesorhizobium amorphae CCBAU 01583]
MRRSRRGYFANISYVDDKLGELLDVLKRTRMLDDTVILFCSDHGDMLGERGLWFKMSFFEGSVRVPLMIAGQGVPAGLVEAPVSNLDVTPTLCDLAGIDIGAIAPWTDGQSLLPLTEGGQRTAPVLIEYAAEGSYAPLVAIRDGQYKFVHCELDPPQLFDLESDPLERDNLPTTRPVRHWWLISWARSGRAGTWRISTPPCAKARRAAGSSIRRCATAPITPGISSRCKRPRSATCATT